VSDSTERARSVPPHGGHKAAHLVGKYIVCEVAQEAYGLALRDVCEIDSVTLITRLPGSPEFVCGVIDLRGRIVPVIELRARFGLPRAPASERAVVIVAQGRVDGRELTVGFRVDRVLEVALLEAASIELPPEITGRGTAMGGLVGVGRLSNRIVFLLDIARLLTAAVRPATSTPLAVTGLPAHDSQPSSTTPWSRT